MYVNDPLGDLLTRIRNALMRDKTTVIVPASKMLTEVANILQREGFISGFRLSEEDKGRSMEIELRYEGAAAKKNGVIRELKRVSKPGVRRYIGYRDIKKIKQGQGVSVLSTSRGIMTGEDARKQQVGGEVLFYVW